jgi:SAM-dependent methyltransferase
VSAQPRPFVRSELSNDVLRRLHAAAVTDDDKIRELLDRLRRESTPLLGRRTLRGDAEEAWVNRIEGTYVLLRQRHLSGKPGESIFLNFALGGRSFFFAAELVRLTDDSASIAVPGVIYVGERRERVRRLASHDSPRQVQLKAADTVWEARADVSDFSPVGLCVSLSAGTEPSVGASCRVRFLDGELAGSERWGQVRNVTRDPRPSGWVRLGLAISEARHSPSLPVEHRDHVANLSRTAKLRRNLEALSVAALTASERVLPRSVRQEPLDLVAFANSRGEPIRGIIDSTDSRAKGALGVVIPPAWGRTKETLLPLALSITETFRRSGESVVVLRFDGTRRRGESYKEPGYEEEGREHLRFTFSHAVDDILAASEFLTDPEGLACSSVVLVTFSAASVEGRRAIVLDRGRRICGWVSIVGSPDLQAGLRAVSGGIDYVAGAEQGIRFGEREIMGVVADLDRLLSDALENRMAFLEDARRDLASIEIPIAWIHGANDGWLDLSRVREIMGCGPVKMRSLLEVPTGHQLRSSMEALDVFQLVSQEVAHVGLGRRLPGASPRLSTIEARRRTERGRLVKNARDVHGLWRSYLLGRGPALGIELMNATRAFEQLMAEQAEALVLEACGRVADLGSGTGSFPLYLVGSGRWPSGLIVDEFDYVVEALDRARDRLSARGVDMSLVNFIECNLDEPEVRAGSLATNCYDAVLLSLLISYVRDPAGLLRDVFRALKPGGRLVVSTLRRDADVSKLFLEGVDELRAGRARARLGGEAEKRLDDSARQFLNDAARVMDLEEEGVFRFLDQIELRRLVSDAGFEGVRESFGFGDPPQAVVVRASRP